MGNLRALMNTDSATAAALPNEAHCLVVAILKDTGAVDQLLGHFATNGVRGATVLDGRGMAEHLSAHLSLFAGFKSAFTAVGHSQVVLTVVAATRRTEVLALIADVGGLAQPGTGIAFAIDLAGVVGLAPALTPLGSVTGAGERT